MPGSAACARSPADRSDSLFQAVDDERAVVARHALVDAAEGWRVVVRRHATKARRHGDILLAADGVADDPTLVAGAVGVIPQLGSCFGIVSVNHATRVRYEHEIARGRQDARERRLGEANLPLLGPGHRVARVAITIDLAARRRSNREVGTDVELGLWGGHRRRLHDVERHAPFLAELVV